jgi:hypothetical protein
VFSCPCRHHPAVAADDFWLLFIIVIVCRIKENGIRSYYQEQHGMKKGKNFVWFLYL